MCLSLISAQLLAVHMHLCPQGPRTVLTVLKPRGQGRGRSAHPPPGLPGLRQVLLLTA